MSTERDDFDISDDVAIREDRPLGLVVPSLPDDQTVTDAEEKFRKAKAILPIVFSRHANGDESSVEVFDDPRIEEEFRVAMDWPRAPTVAEAEQWLASRVSVWEAQEWRRRYGTK